MSENRFTEVTNQSWFSRIRGAFKGILMGLVLFVVAFPLLFLNEGRAVKTYKTLKEGGKTVITVASGSVDAANEGKLVHVTGLADTETTLTDPVFGVSEKALKLKRTVEMYQWNEKSKSTTKKKLGGGTETTKEYSYSQEWSDKLISTADFKLPSGHENPPSMPYRSSEQVVDSASLDAFSLPPSLVAKINNAEALGINSETILPEAIQDTAQVFDGGFYFGTNSASPRVGDVRVMFDVVRPSHVSVIAKQTGNTFAPYVAKASGTIELLQVGVHTADDMIQAAQASNRMLTWIVRLVGFLLMMGGLNLVFKPLSVVADILPIAGTIIGAGTGLVAFLLAAAGSLVTIAIAWVVYRPLVGIILLIIAVGVVVMLKGKLKPTQAGV